MLYAKRVGILRQLGKALYKRCGKAIGYLQAHAEQHRENKEYGHAFLTEQSKGTQSKCIYYALVSSIVAHRAMRQCERIEKQH